MMIRSLLIAVLMLTATASGVGAQQASLSEREDLAAKVLATTIFVEKACAHVTYDKMMLRGIFLRLGINPETFADNEARMSQVGVLFAVFFDDANTSCNVAWSLYGSRGSLVPGLLITTRD